MKGVKPQHINSKQRGKLRILVRRRDHLASESVSRSDASYEWDRAEINALDFAIASIQTLYIEPDAPQP